MKTPQRPLWSRPVLNGLLVVTLLPIGGATILVRRHIAGSQSTDVQNTIQVRGATTPGCGLGRDQIICALPGDSMSPEAYARYEATKGPPDTYVDPNAPDPFAPENTVPYGPGNEEPEFPGCKLPDERGYLDCPDTYHVLASGPTTTMVANRSPVCTYVAAVPERLWPPNHQLNPVVVAGVTDPDNDAVSVQVTAVTQDEPISGMGSGDTAPDAVISATGTVQVRAERGGSGDGRVYRILFSAVDGRGGSCTGIVIASVPPSNNGTAIDSGLNVNSTG